MDDDWIVQDVEDSKGVRIRNIRTDHVVLLEFDHIQHYTADPRREYDGLRHGFFELRVQLFLRGPELVIEPRPSYVKAKRAPTRRSTGTARKRTAR
ncbi:MAG: hypothetical protein HY525_00145 [Betaproteobacteria bacterium]|nr:hypothetical protein [Betaproteobacteria bacterium]